MKGRDGEESIYSEFVTIWKMEWGRMDQYINDVNDGCLATCEGTTETIFRVSGKNQTHNLHNDSRML